MPCPNLPQLSSSVCETHWLLCHHAIRIRIISFAQHRTTTTCTPHTVLHPHITCTHTVLKPRCSDNLEADLKPWKERGPYSVVDYLDLIKLVCTTLRMPWSLYARSHIVSVFIRNNTITWWSYPGTDQQAKGRVREQRCTTVLTNHSYVHP